MTDFDDLLEQLNLTDDVSEHGSLTIQHGSLTTQHGSLTTQHDGITTQHDGLTTQLDGITNQLPDELKDITPLRNQSKRAAILSKYGKEFI
ncbi:MAG: hypothetical protein LBQ65_01295 [Tannerellaceae bacterium]|jgi:hypothetical protein|nr:hypothetical protein [Tannerellaceae bacterium]